jgi:hypothetical protein
MKRPLASWYLGFVDRNGFNFLMAVIYMVVVMCGGGDGEKNVGDRIMEERGR